MAALCVIWREALRGISLNGVSRHLGNGALASVLEVAGYSTLPSDGITLPASIAVKN
jgi:hypothetical protein